MHYGAAVHLHHVEETLLFNGMKFAVLPETSVVDQQIDLDSFFFGEGENLFRSVRVGEVRREHFGGDLVGCSQPARQLLEAILPACGKNEFRSAGRQFFRERDANPCAGSSDESPFPKPISRQGWLLSM